MVTTVKPGSWGTLGDMVAVMLLLLLAALNLTAKSDGCLGRLSCSLLIMCWTY